MGSLIDELQRREAAARAEAIALRWEAIAADGKLSTALDADLMLTPAGDQITVLALAGAYRPPPGPAAGLDRAIVPRCAAAAIRCLLARTACALVHPAGAAGPADGNSSRPLGNGKR
jgi:hypothetical protein